MTIDHPDPETADAPDRQHDPARKNRGVRFSDSEWKVVREAAQTHGVTPAEFVREKILDLVRNPQNPASFSLPAHLAPLIERTFRYTSIMATRIRADMSDNGERERLQHLVEETRELQNTLKNSPPE